MFEYFPDNYGWSLSVMIAMAMGAELGEVDEIGRRLQHVASADSASAGRAWLEAWGDKASSLFEEASQDERAGHRVTASHKFARSATYALLAERQVGIKDETSLAVYRAGLEAFRRAVLLSGNPVEFVDVPFGETALPALFVPSGSGRRSPCVIHFDGLDVMKEILYFMHGDGFRRRDLSVLFCDQPGVGEAVRLRGLRLSPRTEDAATACVDYLTGRAEVDAQRIGIMALSLGGYYAPRAAAFEKRLGFCVAWGAIWDLQACLDECERSGTGSVPLREQLRWVLGVDDGQVDTLVREFNLESSIGLLECPLLVVHGASDRQAPAWTAQRTHDGAVRSSRRELKIYETGTSGSEHCQLDAVRSGLDFMLDWIWDVTASDSRERTHMR